MNYKLDIKRRQVFFDYFKGLKNTNYQNYQNNDSKYFNIWVSSKLHKQTKSVKHAYNFIKYMDTQKRGYCHLWINTIANKINKSRRHTFRILKKLEELGLIARVKYAFDIMYFLLLMPLPRREVFFPDRCHPSNKYYYIQNAKTISEENIQFNDDSENNRVITCTNEKDAFISKASDETNAPRDLRSKRKISEGAVSLDRKEVKRVFDWSLWIQPPNTINIADPWQMPIWVNKKDPEYEKALEIWWVLTGSKLKLRWYKIWRESRKRKKEITRRFYQDVRNRKS